MSSTDAAPLSVPRAATQAASPRFSRSRLLLFSVLAWALLCLFQTLARYNDMVRAGRPVDLVQLFSDNMLMYIPWMAFSFLLYELLSRSKHDLTQFKVFALALILCSLLFVVPYEIYLVVLQMLSTGIPLSELSARLAKYPASFAFVDYVLFVGCFGFIYALAVFQRTLRDERRRQKIEAENLALRLEVEQGRLAALQGQLEPHFLFNALNALSALVRSGEQPLALSAIQRLSELLRYAIAASNKEWTTLADEMVFVEDYVGLQRLRYGNRLNLSIDGMDSKIAEVECPPLLLQPLIENALRHDLDVATGPSDIRMEFVRRAGGLRITISNPLRAGVGENGGTGIGLRNIQGRLALVYGARAAIQTHQAQGRFVVELDLPLEAHE